MLRSVCESIYYVDAMSEPGQGIRLGNRLDDLPNRFFQSFMGSRANGAWRLSSAYRQGPYQDRILTLGLRHTADGPLAWRGPPIQRRQGDMEPTLINRMALVNSFCVHQGRLVSAILPTRLNQHSSKGQTQLRLRLAWQRSSALS